MAWNTVEGREREYDDWIDPYNANTMGPSEPTPTSAPNVGTPPSTPPRQGYYWAWDPQSQQWMETLVGSAPPGVSLPPTTPTGPPAGPTGQSGPWGGGGTIGGLLSGGSGFGGWPSYQSPSFADPGRFDPGPAFSYKDFSAPQGEDVLKDPGFQFRMDQGRKALEASAAGKGVLRSGGTLKDLLSYGQNFASQEYGNVFNRALQEYDTNRHNAFDTWNTGYQGRKDAYGFGADRSNSLNAFNLNNSQFDYAGKQQQAQAEFDDLFKRWNAEGNWTKDLAIGGLD